MFFFLLLTVFTASETPASPKKIKIALLDVRGKGDIAKGVADIFSDMLQSEVRALGHDVIGKSDIEQVLGLERIKDSLGCSTTSCMAEIGGALGVEEILAGSVAKIGSYLVVTVKRVSPKQGNVIKSAERRLKNASEDALVEVIGDVVGELYGTGTPRVDGSRPPAPKAMPTVTGTEAPTGRAPPLDLDEKRKPPAGEGFFCFSARRDGVSAKDFCYESKAKCEELSANLATTNAAQWHDIGPCTRRPVAVCTYVAFDATVSKYLKPKSQCFASREQCLETRAEYLADATHIVRLELCIPAGSKQDAENLFSAHKTP